MMNPIHAAEGFLKKQSSKLFESLTERHNLSDLTYVKRQKVSSWSNRSGYRFLKVIQYKSLSIFGDYMDGLTPYNFVYKRC